MAKDLYGIKSVIKESIAETPVVLNTELVFIGCAEKVGTHVTHTNEAIKITSRDDYESAYGKGTTNMSLKLALDAFLATNIDHCWMINMLDGDSVTTDDDVDEDALNGAINALNQMFPDHGVVPNIVCAPGLQHSDDGIDVLGPQLATACLDISEMFKAQLFINGEESTAATAFKDYVAGKDAYVLNTSPSGKVELAANVMTCIGYISMHSDWKSNKDAAIPFSAVAACLRAEQDAKNIDGIPYRSIGNLNIPYAKAYLYKTNDSTVITAEIINPKSVNDELAANGLIIAKNVGQRRYRTWGDHTSAVYTDGQVDDELNRFDSNIAVAYYLANRFILKWESVIDSPMKLSLRNDIIASEQSNLDYMVAIGALIGSPKCEFISTTDNIGLGQFVFKNTYTTTIPAKYLEMDLVWTSEGLKAYID